MEAGTVAPAAASTGSKTIAVPELLRSTTRSTLECALFSVSQEVEPCA